MLPEQYNYRLKAASVISRAQLTFVKFDLPAGRRKLVTGNYKLTEPSGVPGRINFQPAIGCAD